jgi:hypothetical protein
MTRIGAPRIFRIFASFCAATNRRVIGCSPTPSSMRTSRISNSRFAFLLGLDIRALAAGDDARFVDQFLGRLVAQDEDGQFDDESDFGMKSFRGQIYAFRRGFAGQ